MMTGRPDRASAPRAGALAFAVTIALSSVAAASALGSASAVASAPGVARHGVCMGGSSHWRLRVIADDAGILVVRFRVAGGSSGETWNLFLDRNGTGFFAGSKVSDETGLIRVGRRIADLPGEDVIRAAGHDVATGEVCRGRAHI